MRDCCGEPMEARFFQYWAYVLRGIAMFRECLKRMTRASILHAACLKIINVWSGMLSAWSASRLFRSFSMQYVRALAQLSWRLAREDEQNNTLAHVIRAKVSFWRCRRTLMFPSPTTYSKQFTMADSIIQNGEAYGGLGTCRFEGFMWVLLFLPRPRGTSASLVVPTSWWCLPAYGE